MCPHRALVRAAFYLAASGVFMDRSAHDIFFVDDETTALRGVIDSAELNPKLNIYGSNSRWS